MAYNGRKRADDCLILALASGMTVAAASERCRVCERTIYNRLHESDFQKRLEQGKADFKRQTIDRLSALLLDVAVDAAVVLRTLLRDESPHIRQRAVDRALESGLRVRETDLEQRMAALEQEGTA
jgi:hypothetical protein